MLRQTTQSPYARLALRNSIENKEDDEELYIIPGKIGRHPLPEIWSASAIYSCNTITLKALARALTLDVAADCNAIIKALLAKDSLSRDDIPVVSHPLFYQLMNKDNLRPYLSRMGIYYSSECSKYHCVSSLIRSWFLIETEMKNISSASKSSVRE